jgi:hypothetical protein
MTENTPMTIALKFDVSITGFQQLVAGPLYPYLVCGFVYHTSDRASVELNAPMEELGTIQVQLTLLQARDMRTPVP